MPSPTSPPEPARRAPSRRDGDSDLTHFPVNAPKRSRFEHVLVEKPDTRETSRRIRMARHRRQSSMLMAVAAGLALSGALGWAATHRPESRWPATRVQNLAFIPVALSSSGRFALSDSGDLWSIQPTKTGIQTRKIADSDFASREAPVENASGSQVAVAALDGSVNVRSTQTGQLLRHFQLDSEISTRPLYRGNLLVAACDSGLVAAWDTATGAQKWRVRVSGTPGEALTLAGSRVLVPMLAGQGARGGLTALDLATGRPAWQFPKNTLDRSAGTTAPFFEATSQRLYWANDEGGVFCLDANAGRKIWKSFAHAQSGWPSSQAIVLRGSPLVWNGSLYVGGNDGYLRAFDTQTGKEKWATSLKFPILSPVRRIESGKKTYLAIDGEVCTLLDARTGAILQRGDAGLLRAERNHWTLWSRDGQWRQLTD